MPISIHATLQCSSVTTIVYEEYDDEPVIDVQAEIDRAFTAIVKADAIIARLHSLKNPEGRRLQRSLSDTSETIIHAIIYANAVQLKRSRSQLEDMLSTH